jgi:hypothetical protein
MSSGLRNPEADENEAEAIAALLPRAGWSLPHLEALICVMLEKPGGPSPAFINEHIRPAIESFFAFSAFDGVRRTDAKKALNRLLNADTAKRPAQEILLAKEALFRIGLGPAFGVNMGKISVPADGSLRSFERKRVQTFLAALRGTGQDETRATRHCVNRLARSWLKCGGSKIVWSGYTDSNDPQAPDQCLFGEIVHLIFDEFREAVARSGEQLVPTIFEGAPEYKTYKIPSVGAVNDALRAAAKLRA